MTERSHQRAQGTPSRRAYRLRAQAMVAWCGTPMALAAQHPTTHALPASPPTVAYGYYWADAKPVLRIASGDIIDVHTMLEWPRGETRTHWITMGTDQNLAKATRIAIQNMVGLLMEKNGLTRVEAYQLSSIAADLRITQLVDGTVGVHMMFPKSLLKK